MGDMDYDLKADAWLSVMIGVVALALVLAIVFGWITV
jgi:hypothetical protein